MAAVGAMAKDAGDAAGSKMAPSLDLLVSAIQVDATYEDVLAQTLLSSGRVWLENRAPMAFGNTRRKSAKEVEPKEPCAQEECSGTAVCKGFCAKHLKEKNFCAIADCTNTVVARGVCAAHVDVNLTCSAEGCDRLAQKNGVCTKHGALKEVCKFANCNNYGIRDGVCIKHGAYDKRCGIKGCRRIARNQGMCLLHNPIDREPSISSQFSVGLLGDPSSFAPMMAANPFAHKGGFAGMLVPPLGISEHAAILSSTQEPQNKKRKVAKKTGPKGAKKNPSQAKVADPPQSLSPLVGTASELV